jgi:hypothetical protein
MNEYTLVGPTKRYPCDFSCLANACDSGVDLGSSAARGARFLVISYDFASAPRVGDADMIARALSTVALILARLRMIEASPASRSTLRCSSAAYIVSLCPLTAGAPTLSGGP